MEKQDFLFSIIVPVYNTGKYIEKCLKSIEEAIDTDCEVIIVNDGSTDNSEKLIFKFIENLPEKFKNNFVYTKKANKGLADTKNVGIKMSRGKYISVVDSDDYISDDFYTIARRYIPENEIIIYDLYVEYEKNKIYNYVARAKQDYIENKLTSFLNGAMSGSSCNKIILKDLYADYEFPVGKQYEDTAVTPFILTDASKIKYIPYPVYHYLQREKSIVASNTYITAYYKICSNISAEIRRKNRSLDKYKLVIKEFFTDRMLEMLSSDYSQNKKDFLKNIQGLAVNNKEVINYVIDADLIYNLDNNYSPRQKKVTKQIFIHLRDAEYSKIKNLLVQRKIINFLRRFKWR